MIGKVLPLVGIAAVCAAVPVALTARQGTAAPAVPSRAVATSLPGAVSTNPVLDALQAAHPDPGSLQRVRGPFDDRFTVSSLQVQHGVLTGSLTITSDVSDIVDLQVLAGFYDRAGHLLSTAAWERHTDGDTVGRPDERVRFTVRGPSGASSVRYGVPVLVNE